MDCVASGLSSFAAQLVEPVNPQCLLATRSTTGGTTNSTVPSTATTWSIILTVTGNSTTPRKLRVWRDQKCIPLVGAKTPLTCAGRHPSQRRRNRDGNGNLRKLGWTYRHGTVFAPRQALQHLHIPHLILLYHP